MPMLNFRIVRPAVLIDIGRLAGLDDVQVRVGGGLTVGALTKHRTLETSPLVARHFPVIPDVMQHVAHLAIRNRGTIGGSLSHADPAAELPMLARLLDAVITACSVRGERAIRAADFFDGSLATVLAEDEMVVRVDLPGLPDGMGWGFDEVARRAGDFALAAVAVLLHVRGGTIAEARIAMMGVGATPLRCPEAEAVLTGQVLSDALVARTVQAACAPLRPNLDVHASSEYRRHLAGVLVARAVRSAWRRAGGDAVRAGSGAGAGVASGAPQSGRQDPR